MTINKQIVERIRSKILALADVNEELFHPSDVERVGDNDWTIERFVMISANEDQAFKSLFDALQWRKSFGVNDFTDDYFPDEFYRIGMFSTHALDREGRLVMWIKVHPRSFEHDETLSLMQPLFRQFLVYNFDKADRQCKDQGWAMVVDTAEAGVSTADRANTQFGIEVMIKYFPRAVKYVAVVDQPWILRTFLKFIISFLDEELRNLAQFISSDELAQYLHPRYIPVQLNGSFCKPMAVIPRGVRPFRELAHKWFDDQQIASLLSAMDHLAKQAMAKLDSSQSGQ